MTPWLFPLKISSRVFLTVVDSAVQKLPIYKASFLPESNSVIITGRRPFFYTYDMVAGKVDLVPGVMGREEKSWETHFVSKDGKMVAFLGNDGYVVLLNPHSKQAIGSLKLNGSVRSAVFTADGTHLLASGSDGDITRYAPKIHGRLYGLGTCDIANVAVSPQ